MTITQARLQELLVYEPLTGVFRWRVGRGGVAVGTVAGNENKALGYVQIRLDGVLYYAHRLAWLYVTGEWPAAGQIDHVHGMRSDNRLDKLRAATHAQNHQNRARNKNNTSGFIGVSFCRRTERWSASIETSGKQTFLGRHDTAEQASAAYLAAKAVAHKFQPTPRQAA